jgi:succinoglycan biosynthesis protein ExoM
MNKPIGVLIPTFRRPDSLERAIRSVFDQAAVEELLQDIVIVDNSPEGSARKLVSRLRGDAPVPILYVHEPRPGVATARNSGLEAVNAPYVAFLDDDEEAPSDWIVRLFHTHRTFKADVTFGPVRGVVPEDSGWAKSYLERFFSRIGPKTSGLTHENYGCGNSMMTRATALHGVPFDPTFDEVGGEDDWLFERLRREGCIFAWSAEAWVWEHAPTHRANLAYTLRRAFSYGQTPARTCVDRRDWVGMVYWMAVGAGQAAVYGAIAYALKLMGSPRRADMADKAARGLGKVIWWNTPRFYGEAEAARSAPAPLTAECAP